MAAVKRLLMSASPAFAVFIATVAVSLALGEPADLFHTNSTRGLVVRSIIITCILVVTVPTAPRIVAFLSHIFKEKTLVGQLVKTSPPRESELERVISWFLRPIQGIGLCLLAGESLIELIEYGTGLSYSAQLARTTLFILGSLIVSVLLSIVWTLDDLGLKIYQLSGDLNSAGNTVGTVLPIVTGAIGITRLFQFNTPIGAIYSLAGLIFALYPPYLVFAVIHDEYIRPRVRRLNDSLILQKLETYLS